ncbi:hypothetical protein ES705_38784 [subsurface metagenome]
MKNKIGWCNLTFNPVWGCKNVRGCNEYCYARIFAKRFYKKMSDIEFEPYLHFANPEDIDNSYNVLNNRLRNFVPTFLYYKFDKKFPKKPQKIFIGSMSEIAHWEVEWVNAVLRKIKQYPQHIFQFLTRYPEVYYRYIFPENCWLGVTITREKDLERGFPYLFITSRNIIFISIEPILEYINPGSFSNANIDWVILGAETGKRKGKIIPKKDWIENIVNYCKCSNIPVYLKDSLKGIYPENIKMFPQK